MSTFTYQILNDNTQKTVIKLTGSFTDGTQEANSTRIQANTLSGALDANGVPLHTSSSLSNTELGYYGLQVTGLNYNINMPEPAYVQLYWQGTTPGVIANLNRNGQLIGENLGMPSIPNNALGANGHIGVATFGATANSSYTIILELRKDNAHYDRGQYRDPAAFNYGDYSKRP